MNNKKTSPVEHAALPKHGFDGAGHMDAGHAKRLLDLARQGKETDSDEAFVKGSHTNDDLAEELAESAVVSMTSGEDQLTADLNAEFAEERGGPFIRSTAGAEFADGTDESNPADATREPFPTP